MIIWINGAFGVGKTSTAFALQQKIPNAFVFDPEEVGFFLQKFLPNVPESSDFQYHPLWRKQVVENLVFCDNHSPITLVPMTIVDDSIFEYIMTSLHSQHITIKHFCLMANRLKIEQRLTERGDKNAWNFHQVSRCLDSLIKSTYQMHIDTEQNTIPQVVEIILNQLNLSLCR